jgi:CheY-like chemotaxis protein
MDKNRRVVVIDDDELVRGHITLLLGPEGYEVFEAPGAQEGLKLIAEHRPAVVLVDMIMPEKDGVELIAEIRRRWSAVRIVAISGGGRVGPGLYLDIARTMGADACLTKPLTFEALRQAFETAT